jgi:hypothetical protein
LPQAERWKITKLCSDDPVNYHAPCGGIGPLHIPSPPAHWLLPVDGRDNEADQVRAKQTWDLWYASLTPAQTDFYDEHCQDERWAFSELCGATPLVLAFDDQPVAYTTGGRFAFTAGDPVATDWPTAVTPWLALDRDGDGAITNGAELFGSSTPLPDGRLAADGFAALAVLDANHDGRIDRDDPAFASLVLWADRDGDRHSSPDELRPASEVIDAISLDVRIDLRCTERLDCERERAALSWHDGGGHHTGSVVDVHLRYR